MRLFLITSIFASFLLFIFTACNPFGNEGISLDSWNPAAAVPLFYSTVTIGELLESYREDGADIQTDAEGGLTLVYTNEGYSVDLAELFTVIPDISFPLPDNLFVFPYTLPNNISIDYILIKQGKIKYEVFSPFNYPVDVTLRIQELALDGNIFEKTFTANFLQNLGEYDVSEYILTPNNDTLYIEYEAYKSSDGTEVDLDGLIGIEFSELKHSYAQGYLGMGTYDAERDTIPVDFFQYFSEGEVFLEEPRIEVRIQNSFGFPVRMSFNILQAVTEDLEIIPLSNAQLAAGVDFNYPSLSEVGQTKETVFVIDQANSNIENIIGKPVTAFDYEIVPVANPDSDTSIIGFLTDTSRIAVDVLVELPLYGSARNFTFSDTFDIDLSSLDDVNYAEFKLVAENGFPVDVNMQVYMLDDSGVVIDSLLGPAQRVMSSAPVDGEGRVNGTTVKETITLVEEARFIRIRDHVVKAILVTSFTTINEGGESVRIYEDYEAKAKLGVIAGVKPG